MIEQDAKALSHLSALQSRARRIETGAGGRGMVWHEWGQGSPLVMLHGGSGSWTHWVHVIPALMAGRRLLVADLPGLGDSPSPPEPYDAATLASIVSRGIGECIDAAQAFDLVGFSFGGIIAGHVALAPVSQPRSLTVVGAPPFGIGSTGPANDLVAVPPDLDLAQVSALHRRNLETLMFKAPSNIDALAIRIHHDNLRRARLKSRKIARTDTLAQALANVTCPLHGIWGEHDVTVHPDMAGLRALFLAHGPDSSFQVIDGAGHWVMYETPAEFIRTLSAALGTPQAVGTP